MGLVETTPAGRATLHTINSDHVAVPVLRKLLDPRELLREIVVGLVSDDPRVRTVAAFGSVGRGEAGPDSDIDLVVLTTCDPLDWDSRTELAAAVERRIGNRCDTLVFGIDEFDELVGSGAEPVVRDIVRDRFLLFGEPLTLKSALHVRARDTARG